MQIKSLKLEHIEVSGRDLGPIGGRLLADSLQQLAGRHSVTNLDLVSSPVRFVIREWCNLPYHIICSAGIDQCVGQINRAK